MSQDTAMQMPLFSTFFTLTRKVCPV